MDQFQSIKQALQDLRDGKIILVVDDPDRENEGDFICAAEFATTENINFMATHGKGLICMPMSEEYVRRLQIPQMVRTNTDNHETAFTISIDHVSTTTGISAKERSMTAMAVISADPAICSRFWQSQTVSWRGTATLRPQWICAAWQDFMHAVFAARSCARTVP